MSEKQLVDPQELESTVGLQTAILFLLAFSTGTLLAVILLPSVVPALNYSLAGESPKAYWYLSRASAYVALTLLWLSMALGLLITNKMARVWPGVPPTFAIHEYVSLLGIGFSIFHAFVLLGDHYIKFTFLQLLMPFSTVEYKPLEVGIGQTVLYVWLILVLSFYVKSKIGQKTWRSLHYISFLVYVFAVYHGVTSGSDTNTSWSQLYYYISGGSLIFLLIYRILITMVTAMEKKAKAAAKQANG